MIDSVKLEETSAATFTTSLNVIYFGFIALEHMSALGLTASIQQGIVGQIIFRARRGLRNMRFNLEMESKKEEPPSLIGLTELEGDLCLKLDIQPLWLTLGCPSAIRLGAFTEEDIDFLLSTTDFSLSPGLSPQEADRKGYALYNRIFYPP